MDKDKATVLGKEINLHQSTCSHYCIGISPSGNCCNIEEVIYLEKDLSNDNVKHKLPNYTNNSDMQVSKIWTKWLKILVYLTLKWAKIIIDAVSQCENCKQFKNLHPNLLWGFAKPQNLIKRYLLTFITLNQVHGTSIWLTNLVDLVLQRWLERKMIHETDETLDQHFWCSKLYFSDHEGEFIGDNFDDTCVGNLIEKFRVQHHSVHGVTILVRDTIIL